MQSYSSSGSQPVASAASAVTGLNVEPGAYASEMARFCPRFAGAFVREA